MIPFSETYARANKAYNQVRQELADFGLLGEGVYLDEGELTVSSLRQRDRLWIRARDRRDVPKAVLQSGKSPRTVLAPAQLTRPHHVPAE